MTKDHDSGRDPNSGHGHVYKRPDGVKARCGGPALCSECARELAALQASYKPQAPLPSKELLQRLNDWKAGDGQLIGALMGEAADEIERLIRERDEYARCLDGGTDCAEEKLRLRAALEWYAQASWMAFANEDDTGRRAREALAGASHVEK